MIIGCVMVIIISLFLVTTRYVLWNGVIRWFQSISRIIVNVWALLWWWRHGLCKVQGRDGCRGDTRRWRRQRKRHGPATHYPHDTASVRVAVSKGCSSCDTFAAKIRVIHVSFFSICIFLFDLIKLSSILSVIFYEQFLIIKKFGSAIWAIVIVIFF